MWEFREKGGFGKSGMLHREERGKPGLEGCSEAQAQDGKTAGWAWGGTHPWVSAGKGTAGRRDMAGRVVGQKTREKSTGWAHLFF